MDLSALIRAVLAPTETLVADDALRDLKPGDKLTGRVVSTEKDGRALVDLGRLRVLAQMAFSVKAGDPLNLEVVENGAVLHFRAERPQEPVAKIPAPLVDFSNVLTAVEQEQLFQLGESLTAPSDSSPSANALPHEILNAVSRVMTMFECIPMDHSADNLATWIKGAVEDQGFFFEKRLADMVSEISSRKLLEAEPGSGQSNRPDALIKRDIKPQLMILKYFLDQACDSQEAVSRLNFKETGMLRHFVEKLLDHVNQQQAIAVTRGESGAPQQVMVHLWPLQEHRAPVKLKIYYPSKTRNGGEHHPHRIAILLDMSRLGPIRVDLTMIEGNLQIGFFVVSEALKDYFQKELPSIHAALAGKFQRLQLDVFVSREKIQRFHTEDLDTTGSGGIDISA